MLPTSNPKSHARQSHPRTPAPRLAAALLALFPLLASAQFDTPATSPTTQPHKLELVTPTVNTAQKQVELPVNFWNEKMAAWVETALSGLPSDFSHETVVAATVTRTTLVQALHQAGFADADAWVSNVKDFPRIRGDRALILLEITRNNKVETYLLDELLAWAGWNTSAGPFGWMFKGQPGETPTTPEAATTRPASAATAPTAPPSVALQVLRDDPQIALRFLGLQHASQSFIDHPTCYDDGMYPLPRFHRNTKVLPEEVFDSNGTVPVKMVIRKVTETEFLTAAAHYWHDTAAGAYIRQQLPIAGQVDAAKAELWTLLPELRTLVKQSATHPETVVLADSPLVARAGVLAAAIEKSYAALDCAWATWAADHCAPASEEQVDEDTNKPLKEESRLVRQHFENLRESARYLWQVQVATAAKLPLRQAGASDAATRAQLRRLSGQAVEAKSHAQQAQNQQVLAYWKNEQSRLDLKDPREDWIREIRVQVALAEARQQAAATGIAFGQALQGDNAPAVPAAQGAYQNALMQVTLASLEAQLANVEFEIRKRQGDNTDPDLPVYQKRRAELQKQIAAAQSATQPTTAP